MNQPPHSPCCCGRINPCTEPIQINDYIHEPVRVGLGEDYNFCGPTVSHTVRDLSLRLKDTEEQLKFMVDEYGKDSMTIQEFRVTLENLLAHYLKLVNSGDAGNWNPEEEAVVIASRKVLCTK